MKFAHRGDASASPDYISPPYGQPLGEISLPSEARSHWALISQPRSVA